MRVVPSAMTSRSASSVRTPPAALTWMCGETFARIRRRSSWVAPPGANPVDVLTKSAPAASDRWQARIFSSSVRYAFSKMTFTIAPRSWATSTIAAISDWTSASRPDRSAPIWMTMSSSVAPSSRACLASNTFVAVGWPPWGKPMTVPTATSVPLRIETARGTSTGRTHTDATSYSAARRQPSSMNASSSSGRNREWSIVLAMSRSVRESIERASVMSVAVRAQHVAGDEEPLLDLLVGPLEPAILVLDDAVALVALAIQLAVDDPPVDLTEPRDTWDLPPDTHREDAALVERVAVDHQVLRLVVEDVLPEFLQEALDVDHLEDQVRRVEIEPDRVAPSFEDPAPLPWRRRDVVAARPLVVREEHRAVLERDLHALVVGEFHDVGPDAQRLFPVVVEVLGSVTTHERVDERDAHLPRRDHHRLEVVRDLLAMLGVGMERVRVVAEAGDRQPLGRELVDDLRGLVVGQVLDVDVARASVAPRRSGRLRPAGDLEDLEVGAGRPVGDVHQRRIRERGGQEAELHASVSTGAALDEAGADRSTSTQRPSRALRAIASPTSISSWPSAKVG